MNSQNILKFFGSKLDIRLDSSEYYDFELSKTENDFDLLVIDFTKTINYSSLIIDSNCLSGGDINSIKPWIIPIGENYILDNCDFTVRRRTELGWTLDFVFDRENLDWSYGGVFYYWGILNESDPQNYLDNNLSFSFTDDGRIAWKSFHYSGYCDNNSGYTETSYIASGQTIVLCEDGTSNNFNITITFKRNNKLEDCFLYNEGGKNDYITGWTVTNPYDTLTGATEEYTLVEILNNNWFSERTSRLGTLTIYLNGNKIYKLKDWEEIIPSVRTSGNTIAQVWGGGTSGSGDLHIGGTNFTLHRVRYFEEPLNFPNIKHHYKTATKPFYFITECISGCVQTITESLLFQLLTEDGDNILTEDNNLLNN